MVKYSEFHKNITPTIQGALPRKDNQAEYKLSKDLTKDISTDAGIVIRLINSEQENIDALQYRLFDTLGMTYRTNRLNQNITQAFVESVAKLAELAGDSLKEKSQELILIAATWLYRDQKENPDKVLFNQVLAEIDKVYLSQAPKFHPLLDDLKTAVEALSDEMTWSKEYLFNVRKFKPR